MKIELGLTSFAENSDIVMPDGKHESISHAQRIRNIEKLNSPINLV